MYTMCSVLYMCICRLRRGSETPEKLIYTHISINLCNQVAKKFLSLHLKILQVHVCWFILVDVLYSPFLIFFNTGLVKEYCRPWRIHGGCYQNPSRAVCRHIPWKCHWPALQGHLWVWYLPDIKWRICCGSPCVLQFRVWTRVLQSLKGFF